MRRLTLIRHAKSSWDDASLSDFERPLNPRGHKNAPLMATVLQQQGIRLDLILSSPATRARSTAEYIASGLAYPPEQLRFIDELYGADSATLLRVVHGLPDAAQHVALVAHNPGLTDFCNLLGAAGIDNLPTCAVATIRFEVAAWQAVNRDSGVLERYEYPRKYSD
jgi:phosphohistidine phosphatase